MTKDNRKKESGPKVRVLRTLTEMDALRPEWDELYGDCRRATPFCSWAWQFGCATYLCPPEDLLICAVYDNELLTGLLPLRRAVAAGGFGLKRNSFAPLGGTITDYNALLVRNGYMKTVLPALRKFLHGSRWFFDCENILPGSAFAVFVRYLEANGYRAVRYESKATLWTDLPGSYDQFLKRLEKKFRRNLRQNQNYMNRQGGYSYRCFERTSEQALTSLIDLHTSRWEFKGESGAIAVERIQQFHRWLCSQENLPFSIEFFAICHEEEIIAVLYGFYERQGFYAYLTGFDMNHNRISPGNMVIDFCVRELFNRGAVRLDLLRGDMLYKKSWATRSVPMFDLILYPPTFSGQLSCFFHKIWMMLKRCVPRRVKRTIKSAAGA